MIPPPPGVPGSSGQADTADDLTSGRGSSARLARQDLQIEFAGSGGGELAARFDLPPGEPLACGGVDNARRISEAARHPKSFISLDAADHLLS